MDGLDGDTGVGTQIVVAHRARIVGLGSADARSPTERHDDLEDNGPAVKCGSPNAATRAASVTLLVCINGEDNGLLRLLALLPLRERESTDISRLGALMVLAEAGRCDFGLNCSWSRAGALASSRAEPAHVEDAVVVPATFWGMVEGDDLAESTPSRLGLLDLSTIAFVEDAVVAPVTFWGKAEEDDLAESTPSRLGLLDLSRTAFVVEVDIRGVHALCCPPA